MRPNGWWFSSSLLLVVAATIVVPVDPSEAAVVEYAVIVSPDVPVSDLTTDELRRLFQFRRRYWRPGSPVIVLLSESGMGQGSFLLTEIYQLRDQSSLRRFILEKLYQGQIDLAPKIVASDEVAIRFVAAGRGLIAVVRANQVGDAGVKVLSLDGMLPGSTGYPGRRSAGDDENR